jgi:hypothetical protein
MDYRFQYHRIHVIFDFEKNWIQQDRIPRYAVYQDQDLPWLVQPHLPLVNAAAVKKSAREPVSEASIKIWHRRLGHVSKEREKLEEKGNRPTGLTWDQDQSELIAQMQMPSSITRIALHDNVQHAQQGQDLHTDSLQDEEIQDPGLTDRKTQEREMQSERIGRQQTPIAVQKTSDYEPITPASVEPTQQHQQTANRGVFSSESPFTSVTYLPSINAGSMR